MEQKLFRLDGKTAFVSGSRGHLGSAMARALAQAGAHVIVNGRDTEALARFAAGLAGEGFSVEAAAFDAHDVAAIRDFFGRPANGSTCWSTISASCRPGPSPTSPPDDFAATYGATVTTAFESVRAGLPALRAAVAAAGDASVINVSSMYGRVAPDGRLYDRREQQSPFHYGPAKAGLEQLTRHLAAELGPEKIRVNALVPGAFPKAGKMPAGLEPRPGRPHHAGPHRRGRRNRGPVAVPGRAGFNLCDRLSLIVDGGWTAW